jgi:hypothetical protein
MYANRVAVMRIQASCTVRRYAFFSVVSFHFVLSVVDQLATVSVQWVAYCQYFTATVACIHVGDMPTPWSKPQITPPVRSQLRCVR